MRITEYFNLSEKQWELDFININLSRDAPLFIDAYALSSREDEWSKRCFSIVDDYFRKVFEYIDLKDMKLLAEICLYLEEPNETCLGLSKDNPRGAFQKNDSMMNIFLELYEVQRQYPNVRDLLETISDMKFYIKGVDVDTVSDIITVLIRKQLIKYTSQQCNLYNISLEKRQSQFYWNPQNSIWENDECEQLIINGKRVLLVPKAIVIGKSNYSFSKSYFTQHDVLDFLVNKELSNPQSNLIKYHRPKKGELVGVAYVTKKSIKQRDDINKKSRLLEFANKYPKVFEDFKKKKNYSTINNEELIKLTDQENLVSYEDFVDYLGV